MALWITILFCSSGCFCRGRENRRKPPTLTRSSPSIITLNGSGIGVCCCSTCSIRKAKQKEQQRKPSKDQGNRGKRTNGKRDDKQHKSWWNNSLEASTRGSLEWHQLRSCSLYAVTVRFRDDKGPSPRTAGSRHLSCEQRSKQPLAMPWASEQPWQQTSSASSRSGFWWSMTGEWDC